MSKSNQKKNVEKVLAEKLRESGLPGDLKCIVGRPYKFVVQPDYILVGAIIGLRFKTSERIYLKVYEGEICMEHDGVGTLISKEGFNLPPTLKGTLRVL